MKNKLSFRNFLKDFLFRKGYIAVIPLWLLVIFLYGLVSTSTDRVSDISSNLVISVVLLLTVSFVFYKVNIISKIPSFYPLLLNVAVAFIPLILILAASSLILQTYYDVLRILVNAASYDESLYSEIRSTVIMKGIIILILYVLSLAFAAIIIRRGISSFAFIVTLITSALLALGMVWLFSGISDMAFLPGQLERTCKIVGKMNENSVTTDYERKFNTLCSAAKELYKFK